MKRIILCAVILLAGCSAPTPATEEVKTVDWYKQNEEARNQKIKECESNPGQLRFTPNCINAVTAESKLVFERKGGIDPDSPLPAKP